jgi:hypothetical protein
LFISKKAKVEILKSTDDQHLSENNIIQFKDGAEMLIKDNELTVFSNFHENVPKQDIENFYIMKDNSLKKTLLIINFSQIIRADYSKGRSLGDDISEVVLEINYNKVLSSYKLKIWLVLYNNEFDLLLNNVEEIQFKINEEKTNLHRTSDINMLLHLNNMIISYNTKKVLVEADKAGFTAPTNGEVQMADNKLSADESKLPSKVISFNIDTSRLREFPAKLNAASSDKEASINVQMLSSRVKISSTDKGHKERVASVISKRDDAKKLTKRKPGLTPRIHTLEEKDRVMGHKGQGIVQYRSTDKLSEEHGKSLTLGEYDNHAKKRKLEESNSPTKDLIVGKRINPSLPREGRKRVFKIPDLDLVELQQKLKNNEQLEHQEQPKPETEPKEPRFEFFDACEGENLSEEEGVDFGKLCRSRYFSITEYYDQDIVKKMLELKEPLQFHEKFFELLKEKLNEEFGIEIISQLLEVDNLLTVDTMCKQTEKQLLGGRDELDYVFNDEINKRLEQLRGACNSQISLYDKNIYFDRNKGTRAEYFNRETLFEKKNGILMKLNVIDQNK